MPRSIKKKNIAAFRFNNKSTLPVLLLSLSMLFITAKAQEAFLNIPKNILEREGDNGAKLSQLNDWIWDKYLFNDQDSAIIYANYALSWAEKEKAHLYQAVALNTIGIANHIKGNFVEALDHYMAGLAIAEKFELTKQQAQISSNIGSIFLRQDDLEQALKYYLISRDQNKASGNLKGEASSLNNLGVLYERMENSEMAYEAYTASMNIKKELNDSAAIAVTLNNIGMIFLDNQNLDSAKAYFNEAVQWSLDMDNDFNLCGTYNNLAKVNFIENKWKKSEQLALKGYDLSVKHGELEEQATASKILSDVYHKTGRMGLAYQYLNQFNALNEKLSNKETEKKILQKEFDAELKRNILMDSLELEKVKAIKNLQIEQQNSEISYQQNLIVIGVVGLVLLAGMLILVFRGKRTSDRLLLNILPFETAQELKRHGFAKSKHIDNVTVLFTDFKGFTALSEKIPAEELVESINECFSAFDNIMEKYGVEKIKTIGDAYMAAGGLPTANKTHTRDVLMAAFDIQEFMTSWKKKREEQGLPFFEIRIGLHSGPVVAGIVGIKKFQYDIWGDTVNTASRMESHGEVGAVNVSKNVQNTMSNSTEVEFEFVGEVSIKGKGKMEMYRALAKHI